MLSKFFKKPPVEAVKAFGDIADLLDVYKENHKVTEEQKTAREAIRAERDIILRNLKLKKK